MEIRIAVERAEGALSTARRVFYALAAPPWSRERETRLAKCIADLEVSVFRILSQWHRRELAAEHAIASINAAVESMLAAFGEAAARAGDPPWRREVETPVNR